MIINNQRVKKLTELNNYATLPMSNFGGIVIALDNSGDMVYIQEIYDSYKSAITSKEIKYNIEEEQHGFYHNNSFYNLNEFMRVG